MSLVKVEKAEKDHLVHYLIRDDFSGVFYAEIHSGTALIPVEEFLPCVVAERDYLFCGMPDFISVPKTVSERFPMAMNSGIVPKSTAQMTKISRWAWDVYQKGDQ